MGLLDLALGKSNPVSAYVDANKNAVHGFFGGLGSGQNISDGLSSAAKAAAVGGQADSAYALALQDQQSRLDQIAYERSLQQNALQLSSQGRNATADWLEKQSNPNLQALAPAVRNGTIAGSDALAMAFKPGQTVSPGDSVLPNPMSPSFGAPAASASATGSSPVPLAPGPTPTAAQLGPTSFAPNMQPQDASAFYGAVNGTAPSASGAGPVPASAPASIQPAMTPVFTAPTADPLKMSVQGRKDAAAAQGLQPGQPGYANFILTGRIPQAVADSVGNQIGTNMPAVELGADGRPDPTQQSQFFSALPPDQASLIKQVINYQIDPLRSTSVRGNERQQLVTLAGMADPTYDQTQFNARAAARKAYTTGQQGQTITSANTVIGHLANLDGDIEKLNNSNFAPLNAALNAGKGALSDPNLAVFNTNRQAVASELAKFFKGTGATDLTTTQEWLARLDPNMGPDALHQTVQDIVGNLMKSRLDEMRSQYGAALGKPADFKFITPETATALKKLGVDPSSLDPNSGDSSPYQEGQTATNPTTGEKITFTGGKWVSANG